MNSVYGSSRLRQIGGGSYAGDATILYNNKATAYPLAHKGALHNQKYAIAQGAGGLSAPKPGK